MPDLGDHTLAIRNQIETDVMRLLAGIPGRRAERVALGVLVNAHHGEDVFHAGETVCGLPFTVDRLNLRSISAWYTTYDGHSFFKATTW